LACQREMWHERARHREDVDTMRKAVYVSISIFLTVGQFAAPVAGRAKRSFTVTDGIELVHFSDFYTEKTEAVQFSPDGKFFVVHTKRGRLDLNRPEDSLRFYCTRDVENFLNQPGSHSPAPIWLVNSSAYKEGPIMSGWRWLADSSGVAFLERTSSGNWRLVVADIHTRRLESLTSETGTIEDFDIRDRRHYVYTVVDRVPAQTMVSGTLHLPTVVITGHDLRELLFPNGRRPSTVGHLWAVVGDSRFAVKQGAQPIVPDGLALSPDGKSLVTTMAVSDVPRSWEVSYPPSFTSEAQGIHAESRRTLHQYVLVELKTGSVHPLMDTPLSGDAGGWADVLAGPSWSTDGRNILLPGTFIKSKDMSPSRPAVVVFDVAKRTCTAVERLKGYVDPGTTEEGYHDVNGGRFADVTGQRVIVRFSTEESDVGATEYRLAADGAWYVARQFDGDPPAVHGNLEVAVKQGLDQPPLLVAANSEVSRIVWDPNPQLKEIEIGHASVYRWKDENGREWKAGLYRPIDYKVGHRYPLVIQTRDFSASYFESSGVYPTAFAARALAASGVMVIQIGEHVPILTPDEA
jgi:dipeptidyl aminopeptidase/acylaminoacyl peptidase